MKVLITTLTILVLLLTNANANGYRAGEITIEQIGSSSVEATVHLIIDIHNDIQDLNLCWGDGFCSNFPSLSPEIIGNWGLKRYTFTALHSYPEQNTYTIFIEDCCFDDELANIPNADNTDFVIETTVTLGTLLNTTPAYSDISAGANEVGLPLGMSGWDDDPEGDEYETELCAIDVANYIQPDLVFPLPGNTLYTNPNSGDIAWVSPVSEGVFLAQTCTSELRNGVEISYSKRIVCLLVGDYSTALKSITEVGFGVFPNPVQEKQLWIHNSTSNQSQPLKIRIHNAAQQLVFEEQCNSGFSNKLVDLNGLPASVYFILLETIGGTYYEKFVMAE